jgi:hypothetical protein
MRMRRTCARLKCNASKKDMRLRQEPDIPVPPDHDPAEPIKEPPGTPEVNPPGPVQEPEPTGPRRL